MAVCSYLELLIANLFVVLRRTGPCTSDRNYVAYVDVAAIVIGAVIRGIDGVSLINAPLHVGDRYLRREVRNDAAPREAQPRLKRATGYFFLTILAADPREQRPGDLERGRIEQYSEYSLAHLTTAICDQIRDNTRIVTAWWGLLAGETDYRR